MLGVVLIPDVFYNILLPMFSASRSPASLLLVCVPPRPTAAWLLLRSVVPYHSLYLLLLLRPSHQVRLLFLSTSLLSLGYPSPTPPGLFLTGYFHAQISGFRYPSPAPPRLFLTGYFDAQVSLFRYPRAFFSLPVLVSLIVCFDALLFSHPTFPSRLLGWPARSLCRLAVRLRFLPLRGFYHSAVFLAPLSPVFWGLCSSAALMLAAPQSSPTSGRLALCAALRYTCDFYRSAVFTAPRFLPLRGFYRSAVFTAPLSPVFWGLCSSAALLLAAPQSSSSSGRTLWCRLVRSVSGGPPFLTLFCAACLTTLGALPLISPVSLLCISYKLGDRRSSRLLSVGTRAPRVLPPPSGTSRRMEIRHFHHRLTEVPSVDMLIEAWNGSIYRWHGVSLWCGFLHIPQIHAPPVPETR